MRNIVLRTCTFLLLFLLLSSCKSLKTDVSVPFNLVDASYYSWIKSENERGTNIKLTLNKNDAETNFDFIVFRGIKLPVSVTNTDDQIVVKAILLGGISRLPIEHKRTEESDRLLYTFKRKNGIFLLENIRRERIVYY